MDAHPVVGAMVEMFAQTMAVPILWVLGWKLFKDLSR